MAQQQLKGATGTVDSNGSLTTYTVPGTTVITPYSISVTTDGSGASGNFLPCLTFRTITGAIIARCPAPEVVSGDAAEVSWFPHVAQSTAAPPPASGGVVSAYAFKSSGFPTFGSGVHNLTFGSLIKNDAAFSASGADPFGFVDVAHGGQIRIDALVEWGSNTGAPYVGQFIVQTNMYDSTNNPVKQLTGPVSDVSEVYSTDVGDDFTAVGTTTFNALDSFYTPPYRAQLTIENDQSVGLTSWAMFVAIENPTGLT